MSNEKPELKNGDQTYRINSDDFGLNPSAVESDFYSNFEKPDDDDDYDEIPF